VTKRAREVTGQFAAALMHVRVTHPTRADFDEDLVFTGLWCLGFLYFPLAVCGRDNGGFHVFPLVAVLPGCKPNPFGKIMRIALPHLRLQRDD
jgi:hypothetical protein